MKLLARLIARGTEPNSGLGWGQLHPLVFFLLAVLLQKQLRWSPSFWHLDSVNLFVAQDGQIDDRRRVNEQKEQ